MHEVSIARGLCTQLRRLAAEHGASRIHRATIEVGAMSNVVGDLLRQAFEVVREETDLIATAELVVREVPLVVRCAACATDSQLERFVFQCPGCGSTRLDVLQGEELLLRDVELEVEEEVR